MAKFFLQYLFDVVNNVNFISSKMMSFIVVSEDIFGFDTEKIMPISLWFLAQRMAGSGELFMADFACCRFQALCREAGVKCNLNLNRGFTTNPICSVFRDHQ